jgi:hypothetical protein
VVLESSRPVVVSEEIMSVSQVDENLDAEGRVKGERFVPIKKWITIDATVRKSGRSFQEVFNQLAPSLSKQERRLINGFQKEHEIAMLGPPEGNGSTCAMGAEVMHSNVARASVVTPVTAPFPRTSPLSNVELMTKFASSNPSTPVASTTASRNVENDISADEADEETKLRIARDKYVEIFQSHPAIPYDPCSLPELGVTFFMTGKITVVDGAGKKVIWNFFGKELDSGIMFNHHTTKHFILPNERYPTLTFSFENGDFGGDTKCSGAPKIFGMKHEVGVTYACWLNPDGTKPDRFIYEYTMTATGLTLVRKVWSGRRDASGQGLYTVIDKQPILKPSSYAAYFGKRKK